MVVGKDLAQEGEKDRDDNGRLGCLSEDNEEDRHGEVIRTHGERLGMSGPRKELIQKSVVQEGREVRVGRSEGRKVEVKKQRDEETTRKERGERNARLLSRWPGHAYLSGRLGGWTVHSKRGKPLATCAGHLRLSLALVPCCLLQTREDDLSPSSPLLTHLNNSIDVVSRPWECPCRNIVHIYHSQHHCG